MTVEAYAPPALYLIQNAGPFAFSHYLRDDEDIDALVIDGDRLFALGAGDFSVAPNAGTPGGTVTLSAAAAAAHAGRKLRIDRSTRIEQGWIGKTAREVGLERQLDWAVAAVQELREKVDRALVIGRGGGPAEELPGDPGRRALQVLAFDAAGDPVMRSVESFSVTALPPSAVARREYASVAQMLSDPTIGYVPGGAITLALAPGEFLAVGPWWYEVAPSNVSDHWDAQGDGRTTVTGLRLYVTPWSAAFAAAFGVPFDGLPGTAALQRAIDYVLPRGFGEMILSAGELYLEDDLSLHALSTDDTAFRHFRLIGAGRADPRSISATVGGNGAAMGTKLVLAPGKRISATDARSISLDNMTISGSVLDGPLVDMDEAAAYGGGFHRTTIVNHVTAPPEVSPGVPGDPCAVRMTAQYASSSREGTVAGRADYRAVWNAAVLDQDAMYYGRGMDLSREDQGSGGGFEAFNIHGFDVGFDCGMSAADWALDPDKNRIGRLTFPVDTQASFCNTGFRLRAGIGQVEFLAPHTEFLTSAAIDKSGGGGMCWVKGGSLGVGSFRTLAGINRYAKYGAVHLGSADAGEEDWGTFIADGTNFSFVFQAGLLVHAGAAAANGEIVLRDCFGNFNGGVFLGVVRAPGKRDPDILIQNWRGPLRDGTADFDRFNFVSSVQLNATAYAMHTVLGSGDERWLARFENCGPLGDMINLPEDIDLRVRKYPPKMCRAFTASGDRAVTLGNAPPVGMDFGLRKPDGGGDIVVRIPDGHRCQDATGAFSVASGTMLTETISPAGVYQFIRVDDAVWTTSATFD